MNMAMLQDSFVEVRVALRVLLGGKAGATAKHPILLLDGTAAEVY
jgi:hypothetical protein